MAIFTRQEFESTTRSMAQRKGLTYVNENRTFSAYSANTSVFLSHSHKDTDIIAEAKTFFEDIGISIYVDWADQTMPQETSGITAEKIKKQIEKNDKFILLGTNGAIASKWCNWEVGIGDIYKLQKDKICILPLADNNHDWHGNEYLQIYPRIEKSDYSSNRYNVIYPDKSSEELITWLKK